MMDFAFRPPHRVITATAPWMTAANAPHRQGAAVQHSAGLNGLDRILRTGRSETTAAARTEEEKLGGRNRPAIDPQGENQNMLGWFQACFSKPARRKAVK